MAELLKYQVDPSVVALIAERIAVIEPRFDSGAFRTAVELSLDDLELKDRISLIADTLATHLPAHYPDALATVEAAANDDLGNAWAAWPLCSFVERHGLDHPELSLGAMTTLTKQWSCEFAIRPYLEHHLDLTRTFMRSWAVSDDESVRRLPSEGSRPLLPWGPKVKALIDDPQIGLEILELLYRDPSETVRRSVANHLNDLSKARPDLVVALLADWKKGNPPVDDQLVRHALRTVVKKGDSRALELLGFTTDPQVDVGHFTCTPRDIELGEAIELTATLTSIAPDPQFLVIDFVVHHIMASGATSAKVFKWTNQTLAPFSSVTITKRRMIQPASTRTYHPGLHRIDLQVSGHTLATTQFVLSAATEAR